MTGEVKSLETNLTDPKVRRLKKGVCNAYYYRLYNLSLTTTTAKEFLSSFVEYLNKQVNINFKDKEFEIVSKDHAC